MEAALMHISTRAGDTINGLARTEDTATLESDRSAERDSSPERMAAAVRFLFRGESKR